MRSIAGKVHLKKAIIPNAFSLPKNVSLASEFFSVSFLAIELPQCSTFYLTCSKKISICVSLSYLCEHTHIRTVHALPLSLVSLKPN